MKRTLQDKEHLIRLATQYQKFFEFRKQLVTEDPVSAELQNPKIPTLFSEHLICHALQEGRLILPGIASPVKSVQLADEHRDAYVFLENGTRLHIEIKASGNAGFISTGKNDREADYVLWVTFNSTEGNLLSTNEVLVIQPTENLPKKLTLISPSWRETCKSVQTQVLDVAQLLFGITQEIK